jgi:ABC-type glycerol-3-phosphate transport system substrate-binding protein
LMAAAFTLSACGGGSQTGTTSVSTPTGNYTVTVTGTATGLNPVTVQIPLSVQ